MSIDGTTNLTAAGYRVEPISGADQYGNPWKYKVTGKRGAVWYIKLQVVNAPNPFLCSYKSQELKVWGGYESDIGRFSKLVEIDGQLHGVTK